MLEKMKVKVKKSRVLQIDNKSTISLTKNPVLHGRSKHISVTLYFLKEKINQGELEVIHFSSEA